MERNPNENKISIWKNTYLKSLPVIIGKELLRVRVIISIQLSNSFEAFISIQSPVSISMVIYK